MRHAFIQAQAVLGTHIDRVPAVDYSWFWHSNHSTANRNFNRKR
ncbi:hypothetical protein CZ674_03830 [Agrococcus casei LMG 22410]|uniref:Uncharacterized protein n=1 Tax=Agrococcus casei LMG 22410 TaxID=1255656 RepID=A0A1R4FCS3_9MICO|nr:hypothetical protein CZ674_03830 [Agrococcus casei LMG 22410]